jgi:hypothetical protein
VKYKPEDILPLRPPGKVLSGHAVFAYKWDMFEGRVRIWIINSFGDSWGLQGKGYFFWDEYAAFRQGDYRGLIEGWNYIDLPNDWLKEAKELPKAQDFKHFFARDLVYGEISEEVRNLQIALKILGHFPNNIKETNYFGPITRRAILEFQMKYSVASLQELKTLNGKRVGPKTRLKLNELFNK